MAHAASPATPGRAAGLGWHNGWTPFSGSPSSDFLQLQPPNTAPSGHSSPSAHSLIPSTQPNKAVTSWGCGPGQSYDSFRTHPCPQKWGSAPAPFCHCPMIPGFPWRLAESCAGRVLGRVGGTGPQVGGELHLGSGPGSWGGGSVRPRPKAEP